MVEGFGEYKKRGSGLLGEGKGSRLVDEEEGFEWGVDRLVSLQTREVETDSGVTS